MDLPLLIARFGLFAVFAGTVFEGETVLLLAGYSAHRGYLDFGAVVAAAWLGAVVGDQFFFWLGRHRGQRLIDTRAALRVRVGRALGLIERHPVAIILSMRFLWGLRMALPIAIGLSGVNWRRFLLLNLVSAALWAPLVAAVGWTSGALLESYLPVLHRDEHLFLAGAVIVAAIVHVWLRRRGKRENER